ncbi:terminase large subunit domain-containing protein [Accumulibacter sp.]|uniref:terminase large subunit domain-containing protein n=1 Tax=Accumulibacter sp. TaxID=2053492 RepID=UPI00287B13F7|nr:terminase family protein [Accumulibacter sp.]MDS4056448.1 terminase family protein [Accumulibacter sp.]HMW79184.1 terminase family protein [Accumulibacter sp.]
MPLYPYQRRWLTDRSRFKIGMFARQTGKTFTTTLEIVLDLLQAEAGGQRARWIILSRGERQAREAMDEGVKRHLRAFQAAFASSEFDFSPDVRALDITLPGGSQCIALPANPDTARGFSASVFLDEFAIHKDSRAIWGALFPVISAGYKIRVTSTPKGKGNKFYELMSGDDPLWSRHRVDIHQAVADGLPRDIDMLRRGLNDPDLWAQEFELSWLDEASNWLDFDLINQAEDEGAGHPDAYQGGPVFVGVDIAARNDLFAIWVLEGVGDVLWTRELIVQRRIPFAEQDALLDSVFRRYRVVRCAMDQTGMGEKPVEDAQRRYGALRVEGLLFSGPVKQQLAIAGKQRFEDRRIRIPAGDYALRADLHALKKVAGAAGGAPRFLVDGDTDGHADRAWACFLACHAAAGEVFACAGYQSARGSANRSRSLYR